MTSITRFVDARARRVEDDHVGTAVRGDESVVEHRLHVPGVKDRIFDAVQFRIDLGVGDGFGDVLHAHHPGAARGAEVGDGSRPGVEVVKHVARSEVGKVAGHLIKFVGRAELVW